jgi:hypothetical protein
VSYICSQKHIFHATFFLWIDLICSILKGAAYSLLPVSLSAVGQLEALLSGCSMLRAVVARGGSNKERNDLRVLQ